MRRLRAGAASALHEAARTADGEESERLTWRALDLLDRARALARTHAPEQPPAGGVRARAGTGGSGNVITEVHPMRKLTAEFLGTLWLVLGGCGSAVLAAKFPEVGIGLVGVALAFGLTVVTMAYAVGHISGAHLNPAVTLGLTVAGRFRAAELPGYVIAQVAGAIVAGAILYLIASGAPGFSAAAGFAANGYGEHSPGHYSLLAGLVCEVVMTFFFLLIILGVTSQRALSGFAPLAIGLGLTLIHLISIPVTNTSVNPARSTGVALFTDGWALAQLWLFWVAPLGGAAVAGLLHSWLGAEDSAADRDLAAAQAALEPGEPLAPATAREPR